MILDLWNRLVLKLLCPNESMLNCTIAQMYNNIDIDK